jgi:hypothetical protein
MLLQQNRQSFPVACRSDSGSECGSKYVKTLGPSQALDEPIMDQKCTPHLSSRATPLTNRERLVLRKQALQMKKRPVLAIGIFLIFPLVLLTPTSD